MQLRDSHLNFADTRDNIADDESNTHDSISDDGFSLPGEYDLNGEVIDEGFEDEQSASFWDKLIADYERSEQQELEYINKLMSGEYYILFILDS